MLCLDNRNCILIETNSYITLVELKNRCRNLGSNLTKESCLYNISLTLSYYDHNYFLCRHDGSDTHRKSLGRNEVTRSEETGVCIDR